MSACVIRWQYDKIHQKSEAFPASWKSWAIYCFLFMGWKIKAFSESTLRMKIVDHWKTIDIFAASNCSGHFTNWNKSINQHPLRRVGITFGTNPQVASSISGELDFLSPFFQIPYATQIDQMQLFNFSCSAIELRHRMNFSSELV